ncbi:polysaccharide biosynthesis protein [Tepidicaulis marinus]|uniref:Polysaccharide biosynthesis protein n=1 Tax=Tepidicaulis marinus TaxID=1333998 RepID=A0A081BDQ2_9HYPH|nr:flippase [Tepidicaulis marinus]GAK46170.1 polysaccharide biosynthesis protein [Tepidicaulis marinus]
MKLPSPTKLLHSLDREAMMTVAARFAVMLAGIVTSIVTARLLGPEGRGLYFYAVTLAGFVTQFGNLGFPSANTYIVARERDKLRALTINSLWLSGLVFAAGAGILVSVAGQLDVPIAVLLLAAALGASNLLFMLMSNLLVGLQRIAQFNIFQIGYNLLVLVAILCVALMFETVAAFLTGSLIATVIAALLAFAVLARGFDLQLHFDVSVLRPAVRYSLRAFIVTLLGFIVLRGNVLILGHFADGDELGYYSVAAQLADVVAILPISFALVVFPRLVRQDVGRYEATWRQAKLVAVIMLLVCGIAALLASLFVRIAFGEAFMPAVPIFYVMLPGMFFLGMSTMLAQFLGAVGLPKKIIAVWLVTTLCLFAVAGLLVPTHQGIGAAAALSVSYTILFLLMSYAVVRQARQERKKSSSQTFDDLPEILS